MKKLVLAFMMGAAAMAANAQVNYKVQTACHPQDVKHYDTELLRSRFMMDKVMAPDEINVTYTLYDRLIYGGAMPVNMDYFSSAISSFEKTDGKLTHKESKKFQQSVLKIINDHIQEKELTPRFIADHLAISVRSLYRKMEEMGEESPTIMIKECRLHVAKDLLLKTKKTIDEIVFEAGFSNKVTFFKVFREKYGCTPKEFRTKHLEEVQ